LTDSLGTKRVAEKPGTPVLWSLLRNRQALTRSRRAAAKAKYDAELQAAESLCRSGDWQKAGQRITLAIFLYEVAFPGKTLPDRVMGQYMEMSSQLLTPDELDGFKF
jgi:hypothetical protein